MRNKVYWIAAHRFDLNLCVIRTSLGMIQGTFSIGDYICLSMCIGICFEIDMEHDVIVL